MHYVNWYSYNHLIFKHFCMNSYYDHILHLIVTKLCTLSDENVFARFSSGSDFAESSMIIKSLVFKIMANSDFCYLHGCYYLFTGEIYEPVNPELIGKAIEEWLIRMRVSSRILHYSSKKFQDEARLSIRINNPFCPVFHIKAYVNGVVDFTDGELRPFDAKYHVIYKHPYEYDPSAKCPMWQSFLRTVLPVKDSRLILQMYLGLCTFDRGKMIDKVENCLMLFGTGSNGKSVIYETITGIFGRENVSSMGLLSLIKGGDERLRNIARIDGKLVNMCPEIQARDISGYEDAFKTLCSGEMVYGRNIGGNVYEVRNVPWMIFNMNNLPKASDTSYGYFRRFLYVMFENVIPEEMQNKHLADDLKQEYPGILNWIIRGGKYLKQRRFVFPKSENSEKQKLIVMGESNITFSWAFARGVRPSANAKGELFTWLRSSDMYNDMVRYAEANGFESVSMQDFGKQLTKLGFGKMSRRRDSKGIIYKVFGCNEKELKTPVPIVSDMDMDFDGYNGDVEYDAEDM